MNYRNPFNAFLFSLVLSEACCPLAASQTQDQKQKLRSKTVSIDVTTTANPGALLDSPEFHAEITLGIGLFLVKEQPFSARVVVQTDRKLGDGNFIHHESAGKVFRDAQGRVRFEQPLGIETPEAGTVVSISDRTAGLSYHLLTKLKKGFKLTRPPGDMIPEDVALAIAEGRSDQPGVSVETIGYQMFGEVQARGTRVTAVTPAGTAGNIFPIEVVRETWYSPELHTVLLVKISDPRSGETVFTLTDIARGEQPASLFEIPQDYEIQEQKVTMPPANETPDEPPAPGSRE